MPQEMPSLKKKNQPESSSLAALVGGTCPAEVAQPGTESEGD